VIARLWHGWTIPENADAYEQLLREHVLPGIGRIEGYHGAYVLRRDAGDDPTLAVVPPEARQLLERFDQRSEHYETRVTP